MKPSKLETKRQAIKRIMVEIGMNEDFVEHLIYAPSLREEL